MLSNVEDITSAVRERVEEERRQFAPESQSEGSPAVSDGSPDDGTIPSADILAALARNQDGDADLFVRLYRGQFAFDHAAGRWYGFTGNFWKEDVTGEVLQAVGAVADLYVTEVRSQSLLRATAARANDTKAETRYKEIEKALLKRIHVLQSLKWKNDILVLARSGSDTLGITGQEWDRDPWSLACSNAIINLKNGTHRQGRPEDYIKTAAPTEWKGIRTPCPSWERFLSDIFGGSKLMIAFVQRLLGYGITGLSILHLFVMLCGIGRNGKGTLLETLRRVLGDFTLKIEAELLLEQRFARQAGSPNSAVLSLQGRRIAWASEASEGRSINTGRLKELVGGDTLTGRAVYGKYQISFEPSHLLFLLTNSKPSAPSNDFAFWQRVLVILFEISFVDRPQGPNERKADPNLVEKLKAEASGILAWLVRGCLAWQKEGLNPPEQVRVATESYRTDEDTLGAFVSECCSLGENLHVRANAYYEAYKVWSAQNGLDALSGVLFGREMKKRFASHPDRNGIVYLGVALKG